MPAGVKISFIWIDQGLNKEKSEQARKKATEALSLLDSGTNFSEVAKNYSEDGTYQTGGELDEWLYQGFLPPELEGEVFALTVGQTSGIIDGGDGLYIIKVREKIDQKQKTYEESVEEIKNHLKEEKHNQIENELEKTLLDNANFTIYDKTLRKILKE
ncbi:Foldase protein PrsA [bioreactor metagenome]|uniref:peptidylprolyl isomerase n=1 Tax=bioreactor metagenome TaxID=1076179 RepID=A0A645A1R7_9ZZZZ